jgi:PPM family protein phosphatase
VAIESIEFAAETDVGRKRDHNEDNYLVDKKLRLFVVCDGMGGHAAGEVASATAVRTLHEEVKRSAEMLDDYAAGKKGASRVSRQDIINMLDFAVNRASRKINEEASKDDDKRGMGTTLVSALFAGNQAFVTHVGDSRLYLLRDGRVEQVTQDHNVHNELLKRKKLTQEEVLRLAPKNAITRAVGVYEHCEPDTLVLDVLAGDRFLLCSDGLTEYFEDTAELARILGTPDASGAAKDFIAKANARGGKDNITALIVMVGDVTQRDERLAEQVALKREMLRRVPLFKHLTDHELLRVLQATDVATFTEGETIMTEGEPGDDLFIVLRGALAVLKGDSEIARLSPGAHVGEMALIRAQPRSATVRSVGASELIVLPRTGFFDILRREHPLAVKLLWQFLGDLADRLDQTNQRLGEARHVLAAEDVTQEIHIVEDAETEVQDETEAERHLESASAAPATTTAPVEAANERPSADETGPDDDVTDDDRATIELEISNLSIPPSSR